MSEELRTFSVEEANELVPTLEIEFGRVARARSELATLVEALGPEVAADVLRRGAPAPQGQEAAAARLRALAGEIGGAVERVNALGCLVKDLDHGLVDFPAVLHGEQVLLCWQFGEPAVTHWHGVDQGFAGRKPIGGVTVLPPDYPN